MAEKKREATIKGVSKEEALKGQLAYIFQQIFGDGSGLVGGGIPTVGSVNLALSQLAKAEVIKNALRRGVTLNIPGVGTIQANPIDGFLNILWAKVKKPGTGQGNVLYNTLLDYAKQQGYKGLMSDPLSRNAMSDRMWDSFDKSGLRRKLKRPSRLSPTGEQQWDVLYHPDVAAELYHPDNVLKQPAVGEAVETLRKQLGGK